MPAELDAAEQFGPYLVYERLGVGGMATVHRALERGIEGFERIVALKRLLPHLAEDASFIKSFVREAKLASFLNHVNIVQIYELGRVGTEYFISMEFIDGRDIRRILRHARKVTGPPPIHVTVGMLLQLCDALEYAHSKADDGGVPLRIVHRDVSPSNVLVTSQGHVKVIDFGIAKAQSSQLRTQTGRVKGKLAYMAPEAVSGKELDARSDLWAAGVIAHELLTARPLFASKNEYQTLLKVQRGDIMPPSTFNQACPPELDAIVARALSRDPDARYCNASELRDELLALRRTYDLATTYRDIAAWVDWAFALDSPVGFSGHTASPSIEISHRTPTPRPRKEGGSAGPRSGAVGGAEVDDEAVEIAWGNGDEPSDVGPIVLDDVPDVSGKHLAPSVIAFEDVDDIPTPSPSHGLPRRGTEPGVTPAPAPPSSGPLRITGRMGTVTTDPAAQPLLDGIDADIPTSPAAPVMPRAKEPTVRFKAQTVQPESVAVPLADASRPVRTKPGVSPARALTSTLVPVGDDDQAVTIALEERARTSAPRIGTAIVERAKQRQKGPKRTWIILAAIFAAGAIATATTLFLTRGHDRVEATREEPRPSVRATTTARTAGTVKFNLEPADAEIWIEGTLAHGGSPWATELEAGVYQIQIVRTGYKAWLTSLELSANETQTLRVVLEPLATESAVATDARLILSSEPTGLEVLLDGRPAGTTPIDTRIAPGPHAIVLRQEGKDVWSHDLVAQADANYEFSPSMDAIKQRERQLRERRREQAKVTSPAVPAPTAPPPDAAPAVAPDAAIAPMPVPPTATASKPSVATVVPATKPVAPPPAPAIAKPARPLPAPTQPKQIGPITVPPTAVTKVSGETPEIPQHRHADFPSVVAAKMCISHTGRVTSVDLISKIDPRIASDLLGPLRSWSYAPYKQNGVPTPVCFALSLRLK